MESMQNLKALMENLAKASETKESLDTIADINAQIKLVENEINSQNEKIINLNKDYVDLASKYREAIGSEGSKEPPSEETHTKSLDDIMSEVISARKEK